MIWACTEKALFKSSCLPHKYLQQNPLLLLLLDNLEIYQDNNDPKER